MKKFKKELFAILCGVLFAYCWQLFALFMCYISDTNDNFITADMFIPTIGIQLAFMPMIAWILMGVLRVSWFKKWFHITMCGLAFLIPFALIASVTVLTIPSLWREPIYWATNILLSLALTFTLFKPLIQIRYSNGNN